MDKDHTVEVIEKLELEKKFKISHETFSNTGHQIIFQEPIQIANCIVSNLGIKFEPVEIVNLLDENHNIRIQGPKNSSR